MGSRQPPVVVRERKDREEISYKSTEYSKNQTFRDQSVNKTPENTPENLSEKKQEPETTKSVSTPSVSVPQALFNEKDKTIPEIVNGLLYKTSKGFSNFFKKFADTFSKETQENKDLSDASKKFSMLESAFNVLGSVFDWVKWGLKIKNAGSSKKAVEEGLSNAGVVGFEFSRIPFLVMQLAQNIWDSLIAIVDPIIKSDPQKKRVEDWLKKLFKASGDNEFKRRIWVYRAFSFLGLHIIDPIRISVKLYSLYKEARDSGIEVKKSVKDKLIKDLIKACIVFALSIAVTILAIVALGDPNPKKAVESFKNVRDLLLAITILVETGLKNCSYPLGWLRDKGIAIVEFVTGKPRTLKEIQKEIQVENSAEATPEKNKPFFKRFIKAIKVFGNQFKSDQRESLKVRKIIPSALGGKDKIIKGSVTYFIFNFLLSIAGFVSTSVEITTTLAPLAHFALAGTAGLFFLYNAALFIDNLIKYNTEKYSDRREELMDKMIGQAIKMTLCLLIIGLTFVFSGPAIGVVAGIATVLFNSYIGLDWFFSDKVENKFQVVGNLKEELDDSLVTEPNILYLYCVNETLKCKVLKGNKVKVITLDETKMDEDDVRLIKETLAQKNTSDRLVLRGNLVKALFKETAKKGFSDVNTKEGWVKPIRERVTSFAKWISSRISYWVGEIFSQASNWQGEIKKDVTNEHSSHKLMISQISENENNINEPEESVEWQRGQIKKIDTDTHINSSPKVTISQVRYNWFNQKSQKTFDEDRDLLCSEVSSSSRVQ